MSATFTTTTTTITTNFKDLPAGFVDPIRRGGTQYGTEVSDIQYGRSPRGHGAPESLADILEQMGLPSWLKGAFANLTIDGGAEGDDGSGLPSGSSAAKTINSFQKDNNIRYLSDKQLSQMAETGYFTDKHGKSTPVPDEVRLAAKKMMANGGELFRKLESATNGKHDGQLSKGDYTNAVKDGTILPNGGCRSPQRTRGLTLEDFLNAIMNGNISSNRPSEYDTAKTINDFQKDHGINLLSITQLEQMAETGYCQDKDGKFIQVPDEVRDAAREMQANDWELFRRLESATDGELDGQLGIGDFNEALKDGSISRDGGYRTQQPEYDWDQGGYDGLPSRADAANTMKNFQKDKDIDLLDIGQVQQMAHTGYYTDKHGKTHPVPDDVQQAARKMLANGSELFKQLESATNGKHDGKLSLGDYGEAVKDGTIPAIGRDPWPDRRYIRKPDDVTPVGYGQASAPWATRTMRDFQAQHHIRFLDSDQVHQMAATGYFTGPDGKTIQVPDDVRHAARRMLANNSELFKSLESATNGERDGHLSLGDYRNAGKERILRA
ncbi:hypothetical protein [Pseudoduganella violaceinigra]|uniref:hypothetical protein n=1 Tax=Pseudoduganella violaceinigra TaxID=246602 RepID=UPI000429EBC9|nr:hypothetical protein [Pseudoduganella violaceinigra]